MKWLAYAQVVGNKYLGEVEADTEQEAIERAALLDSTSIVLCHQCSEHCEDPEVAEIRVEKDM